MSTPAYGKMTESDLRQFILRRLGHPTIKVELTDCHLDDAIAESKRWFAARKGVDREFILQINSGQVEYDVPEDTDAVIDVAIQASPFDAALVFTPNILADEKVPYTVFAAPQSAGLYSSFVQSIQYLNMAKRIINAEFNWLYYPQRKKLLILPGTRNFAANAIVEYKSTITTLEQLGERDHDLIKRFSVAWAKRDLGMIRDKYKSGIPGAQGTVMLNGTDLLAQSEAEFAKLEQEISDSAMPLPWLVG
jgi:hypothetical protein